MTYSEIDIVLQEVPGEISICFTICGCNKKCDGCHSPRLWNEKSGYRLNDNLYKHILNQYKEYATCVLFMGGEWHPKELNNYLKKAKSLGYKTCLYTGENDIDKKIKENLTWLKTGNWQKKLGGLESQKTNQVFRELKTNTVMNHLFQQKTP